ncbi:MAG: SusC/RagA family TonB-linked outer membrane protein, partial [Muribaculaceae bacterium]|nr:SusC/RagA family TonB-linked outer membrane protein [Muribaculaceae bacterium]
NSGTDAHPIYQEVDNTFEPGKTYKWGESVKSGDLIIKEYYTGAYANEASHYITKVNALRMRSVSLSYDVPRSFLAKTKAIKRATITASASNLLLFTNYDGDPEVAAAGAGRGGSSSVGFDYCGVPATASFSFGVNLTF